MEAYRLQSQANDMSSIRTNLISGWRQAGRIQYRSLLKNKIRHSKIESAKEKSIPSSYNWDFLYRQVLNKISALFFCFAQNIDIYIILLNIKFSFIY